MFKMRTLAGMVIAGSAGMFAFAPQAEAELITFDGLTSNTPMAGLTTGSTADVAVSYEGSLVVWENLGSYYPQGFGSSGPVIYNQGSDTNGTITFTATTPGYEVRVDSMVLGIVFNNSSVSLLEYSLDEGATWTEVPTNIAPGTAGLVEFSGVQAPIVQIRRYDQDPSNPVGESDAGIDNIAFTAIVPEPGSLALLGLGGLALLRRRRSA